MVVAEIDQLKQAAQRRLEITFAASVDAAVFESLQTVKAVHISNHGRTHTIIVAGPVDPVIKTAAEHEVESILSHDGDLEEAFLSYYSGDTDAA